MPENDVSEVLISPSEVRSLLDHGEPVTAVDARGRIAFLQGTERVAGDLRAENRDLSWAEGLSREIWLLAYCT